MDRGVAHLMDPETASLRSAERDIRRAQAEQVRQLLAYVGRFEDRHAADEGSAHLTTNLRPPGAPEAAAEARRAAVLYAAQALQASERYVGELLTAASQAQQHLPHTWDSFCQGTISVPQMVRIARSSLALISSQNVILLDQHGSAYAAEHTPGQLTAWLRRFVAAREPEASARRSQAAVGERRVSVTHLEDGVSLLTALLPTVTAEQIRRRLSAVARSPQQEIPRDPSVIPEPAVASEPAVVPEPSATAPGLPTSREAGDTRTLDQRTADLFSAWLLTGRGAQERAADVSVGLLVPLETLSGDAEAPALSRDRSFIVPAPVVRALLTHPSTHTTWYELGVQSTQALASRALDPGAPDSDALDPHALNLGPQAPGPQDPDVLSVRHRGRFVPKILREAIRFRDGTCRAPGCQVPAENCDIDHQRPWRDPGGHTEASNLWALCRRHHRLKTAGYLPVPTALRTAA